MFSDMGLYARLYPMDVALLPIGGVFTMDAYQASEAVKMIHPKMVVPIHYASFPIIAQTAYATFEEKERAMTAGCDDYLTKPIRKEDLFGMIDKHYVNRG